MRQHAEANKSTSSFKEFVNKKKRNHQEVNCTTNNNTFSKDWIEGERRFFSSKNNRVCLNNITARQCVIWMNMLSEGVLETLHDISVIVQGWTNISYLSFIFYLLFYKAASTDLLLQQLTVKTQLNSVNIHTGIILILRV